MKGLLCSLLAMACIYIGSVNIAPGRDIEVFVVGSKTLVSLLFRLPQLEKIDICWFGT